MEHLQFSTAFQDNYDFYLKSGSHELQIIFGDVRDVIDIHKSGLRLFNYCAGAFEMLTSTFSTALLWTGGSGSTTYLPVLGSRPTSYQM